MVYRNDNLLKNRNGLKNDLKSKKTGVRVFSGFIPVFFIQINVFLVDQLEVIKVMRGDQLKKTLEKNIRFKNIFFKFFYRIDLPV